LRASALGGWLRPPTSAPGQPAGGQPAARDLAARHVAASHLAGGDRADGGLADGGVPGLAAEVAVRLGQAVADRGCVLFSLDPGPDAAVRAMIGRLAVADLAAVLGDLSDQGLRGDCLAWVHGCEAADGPALAGLVAAGAATGTAVALSTGSPAAAAQLADTAGVVVAAGPADRRLAAALADLAPLRLESSRQELADLLSWQDEDHFAVLPAGPPLLGSRLRTECRSVPAAWARQR
jgi:hypothetical protein